MEFFMTEKENGDLFFNRGDYMDGFDCIYVLIPILNVLQLQVLFDFYHYHLNISHVCLLCEGAFRVTSYILL